QVIVGAAVESGDFVFHSIARCQQQNGSCHSAFADAGEYLKAITAGKHHIQKNDVKLLRIDTKKSIFARMRNNRLVSLIFKAFLQGIGDFDLIFDYKNTHAVRLMAVGAVYGAVKKLHKTCQMSNVCCAISNELVKEPTDPMT